MRLMHQLDQDHTWSPKHRASHHCLNLESRDYFRDIDRHYWQHHHHLNHLLDLKVSYHFHQQLRHYHHQNQRYYQRHLNQCPRSRLHLMGRHHHHLRQYLHHRPNLHCCQLHLNRCPHSRLHLMGRRHRYLKPYLHRHPCQYYYQYHQNRYPWFPKHLAENSLDCWRYRHRLSHYLDQAEQYQCHPKHHQNHNHS